MNRQERHSRDIKILSYIKLNPMNEQKTQLVQRTAKRFNLAEKTIWQILKRKNND